MAGNASIAGPHAPNYGGGSRPSKTNCTTAGSDRLPAGESTWRGLWWKQKNALVDEFQEEMSARANRPVSVRSDVKLREEATREKHDGGYRSKPWSSVLNSFLSWYNGYRHSHLIFRDPDGEEVRTTMPNSHQPRYGDKYYARLKALERQVVKEYDDLHICMLTLTGSARNANGGWRCPADHLRDVVSSWRPDRGRGVYHTLRDSLDGKDWEYALVNEHHKSGYGHIHVAIFVDGEIEESDFHSAIDAHLRCCSIASAEAHDYYASDLEARPISISRVDTEFDLGLARGIECLLDLDRSDFDGRDDISNVGSYLAEYIGSHGEALFDRSMPELIFRAAVWSTGTQMVRFSTGANEMIRADRDLDDDDTEPIVMPKVGFDADREECTGSPFRVEDEGWSLVGVGRVDESGEDVFDVDDSSVEYRNVEPSPHLDPPQRLPPDRPRPRVESATLEDY